MTLLPLHGHAALRARLDDAVTRGSLPGSILLSGPRGVGKQRLALWLGQRLVCSGAGARPCGACQHCRYALQATHPDIHWYFPRPRLKDGDATPAKVEDDFREAIAERARTGAYAPPPPEDPISIATIRALIHSAAMSPALAERKVYVLGDAERMVMREGQEEAAGAFLKLLEEPPARATIVLTSSEPGALIPTIRSRVVNVRVPTLGKEDARAVLSEPSMHEALASAGAPRTLDEQVSVANGAPGSLLGNAEWGEARARAARMLEAASSGDRRAQARTALMQGSARSRGAFSTTLDALTMLISERVRADVERDKLRSAALASRALDAVEVAKERAAGNTNPQLVTSDLLRVLSRMST